MPEAFDFQWVLAFLRPRAITGIEWVGVGAYGRSLEIDGRVHVMRLMSTGAHVHADVTPAAPPTRVRTLVRAVLDLDTDLTEFHEHARQDEVLQPLLLRRPAIRLIRFPNPFEGLVRAILGQQVSLAAASTAAARIARRIDRQLTHPEAGITHIFPSAEALAALPEQTLRETGLTAAKSRALIGAARAAVSGDLDLHALAAAPASDAEAALRSLPGIGPWTAAYVRMRGFGHRDAFPASDLGVIKALRRLLGRPTLNARDAETIAEAWRPWRAYATLHLWHSLADPL